MECNTEQTEISVFPTGSNCVILKSCVVLQLLFLINPFMPTVM